MSTMSNKIECTIKINKDELTNNPVIQLEFPALRVGNMYYILEEDKVRVVSAGYVRLREYTEPNSVSRAIESLKEQLLSFYPEYLHEFIVVKESNEIFR